MSETVRRSAVALVLTVLAATMAAASVDAVNRIVLRVNDRIATLYDYETLKADRLAAITRSQLPPAERQAMVATIAVDTMSSLFEELLVLSRADQLGVEAERASVEASIQRSRDSMGLETEEQFAEALARSGMELEDLREQMRKNLAIQQVVSREVTTRVNLTEEDLRRYYHSHPEEFERPVRLRLREFVVLEEGTPDPDARRRLAEELGARLAAGDLEDEALAAYAERGEATGWVELGWVQPGDLDPQIEAAVWELEAGSTSEPVEARGGLHLIEVLERQEAGLMGFKEVEAAIRQREEDRVFQEEMASYLRELEESSFIVSDPPPEAADFRATLFGGDVALDPLLDLERSEPEAEEVIQVPEAPPSGDGALRR